MKDVIVTFRLSKAEKKRLIGVADAQGMTLYEYLRAASINAAQRILEARKSVKPGAKNKC